MKVKIPKKFMLKAGSFVVGLVTPIAKYVVNKKIKEKEEKVKQEKIYNDQKHNGIIKYASILLALFGLVISILAIKELKIVLGIIGILAIISYIVTFLYCIDIINEKEHNTYKITFIIGNMLMVIVTTLFLF